MTDENAQPQQIRRLSFYRQLSDVLKSKRKSFSHLSPTTNSTFTFVWKCTLTEVNEDLTLVKQKSISYDDVAFLSDQQIPSNTLEREENGRFIEIFLFILRSFFASLNLDSANQLIMKSAAGRERNEKRYSTGSAVLPTVSFEEFIT